VKDPVASPGLVTNQHLGGNLHRELKGETVGASLRYLAALGFKNRLPPTLCATTRKSRESGEKGSFCLHENPSFKAGFSTPFTSDFLTFFRQ
jgi:hypothetical protein